MSGLDLKQAVFMTPAEVAALFRHEGDLKWVWRHSRPRGKLAPAAVRFGRELLFRRAVIDRLIDPNGTY